jgi:RHS repeat-associated protein
MNRYESVDSSGLAYDPQGNTLSDTVNTYQYDILNRQTAADGPGGTADYLYDARGRRVAKIANGVTTIYLYDSEYRVLEERDGAGDLQALYTYSTGIDEVLTMERGGNTYYYHRDALGSITEITDEDGDLVERYDYDVYGYVSIFDAGDNPLTTSAIGNPYLFTGQSYDPESGNYYYRARYYAPDLGRFLGQDPLGFAAGDYNLYRYVANNPATYGDPTGQAIPLIIAGVLLAVKIADYAWTAYDIYESIKIVNDECAPDVERLLAALNIALAAVFELVEPDDFLPIGVPADDIARKAVVASARNGIGSGGAAGFERSVRGQLGDDLADDVFRRMGLCSFSPETVVTTAEGLQPIEELAAGDYVLAYNEATSTTDYYPIVALWAHQDPLLVELTIDGGLVRTTPEHPFYTAASEWVAAADLTVGDEVVAADGHTGRVERIEFVQQPETMYNLTVADAHTYFVGDEQWLVHNQCTIRLGNRRPINSDFAGQTFHLSDAALRAKYPNGVKFTDDGFPDFSPYATHNVQIKMKGNRTTDFTDANQAAGLTSTPDGFTWHHSEDRTSMLLIPTDLHDAVRHSGGVSMVKHFGELP